jgi:hypothetical protein
VFWAWQILYRVSPALAGLVALMAAAEKPGSTFVWCWPGPADRNHDLDDLLADIGELIERAPSPGGLDTYWIETERLGPMASDGDGVNHEHVDATLQERATLASRCIKGDRYYNWKRGPGRDNARDLLAWAMPTAELPVTIVRVTTGGGAVRGAVGQWHR